MFDLGRIRHKAMQEGMKLMGDPRFQKLMMNPRAQKLMMLAFQLPSRIEGAFEKHGKAFAKRFKLATRSEVESLKATIRDLERKVAEQEHEHEAEEHPHRKGHAHGH